MKKAILSAISLLLLLAVNLNAYSQDMKFVTTILHGDFVVKPVAKNAVRIQYFPVGMTNHQSQLPDWLYVKHDEVKDCDLKVEIDN